jgi:hypothetical protein
LALRLCRRARSGFLLTDGQSALRRGQCHDHQPLFTRPDADLTDTLLAAQSFARRTYMLNETICDVNFTWAAATLHMGR